MSKVKEKKAKRAQRCKSLLLLSAPFSSAFQSSSSSSSSNVKSSLLSLWPSTSSESPRLQPAASVSALATTASHETSTLGSAASEPQLHECHSQPLPPTQPAQQHAAQKSVKMKLFEQPLEKLFDQKALKQLQAAVASSSPEASLAQAASSPSGGLYLGKRRRQQQVALGSYQASVHLRRFARSLDLDANNNRHERLLGAKSRSLDQTDAGRDLGGAECATRRQRLLLACLPAPIRSLLNELYLRGPSTIGIFRKSPNARHCRELRHKLENDSQASIEEFQVTVIASVFKEWLRSLPDCLLMSRLHPQWMAVAKLMEPLSQRQPLRPSQSLDGCLALIGSPSSLKLDMSRFSFDSAAAGAGLVEEHGDEEQDHEQDKENSSSSAATTTTTSTTKVGSMAANRQPAVDRALCSSAAGATMSSPLSTPRLSMEEFALNERRNECLRIVGQLLDALNEANLILLQALICVLWHIAARSEYNKMSAPNLGVCVGQSLLTDEHQQSGDTIDSPSQQSSGGQLIKRHRRSRSQCLLASSLSLNGSLSSPSALQHNQSAASYLESSIAQETAKYVPMLVAFMIQEATHLFGPHITEMFETEQKPAELRLQSEQRTLAVSTPMEPTGRDSIAVTGDMTPRDEFDGSLDLESGSLLMRRQNCESPSAFVMSNVDVKGHPDHATGNGQPANKASGLSTNRGAANQGEDQTTSILIVSDQNCHMQRRPLSVSESTSSSSRASSSTSGVHSQSPAFSNELESPSGDRHTASQASCSVGTSGSSLPSSPRSSPSMSPSCGSSPSSQLVTSVSSNSAMHHSLPVTTGAGCQAIGDQQSQASSMSTTGRRSYQNQRCYEILSMSRAPKIPVELGTSTYGGETVIYNPRPIRQSSNDQSAADQPQAQKNQPKADDRDHDPESHYQSPRSQNLRAGSSCSLTLSSPAISAASSQVANSGQASYHQSIQSQLQQQELRQQRLNEYLAHRNIPLTPCYATVHRQPSLVQTQLTNSYSNNYLSYQHQQAQQDQKQQPPRSHVMSLRDYYLSLNQQQHQQRQQQHHHRSSLVGGLPNIKSDQYVRQLQNHQQVSYQMISNYPATGPQQQHQRNSLVLMRQQQLMSSQAQVLRPEPRLARICQNQFSHQIGGPLNFAQSAHLATASQSSQSMPYLPLSSHQHHVQHQQPHSYMKQNYQPQQKQQSQQHGSAQRNTNLVANSSAASSSEDHSSADSDDWDDLHGHWTVGTII